MLDQIWKHFKGGLKETVLILQGHMIPDNFKKISKVLCNFINNLTIRLSFFLSTVQLRMMGPYLIVRAQLEHVLCAIASTI